EQAYRGDRGEDCHNYSKDCPPPTAGASFPPAHCGFTLFHRYEVINNLKFTCVKIVLAWFARVTLCLNLQHLFMTIAAIDYGKRRLGLAAADPSGTIVYPAGAIERTSLKRDLDTLGTRLRDLEAIRVIVGLPLNMDGS